MGSESRKGRLALWLARLLVCRWAHVHTITMNSESCWCTLCEVKVMADGSVRRPEEVSRDANRG